MVILPQHSTIKTNVMLKYKVLYLYMSNYYILESSLVCTMFNASICVPTTVLYICFLYQAKG